MDPETAISECAAAAAPERLEIGEFTWQLKSKCNVFGLIRTHSGPSPITAAASETVTGGVAVTG